MGPSMADRKRYRDVALLFSVAAIVSLQLSLFEFTSMATSRNVLHHGSKWELAGPTKIDATASNSSYSETTWRESTIKIDVSSPTTSLATATTSPRMKPLLLLHVGPPKSGTTTLEYQLRKFQEEMKQDKLFYCDVRGDSLCMGLSNEFKTCGTKRDDKASRCWSKLKQDLWELHRSHDHANLFFSPISTVRHYQRGMGGRLAPIDWVSMKTHLGRDFDIKVLFGYRRYTDWLPSAVQQIERLWSRKGWPGGEEENGPKHEGLFPSRWRQLRFPGAIRYMHTDELVKTVNGTLPYILFNIHERFKIEVAKRTQSESLARRDAEPSLVSRFACGTLIEAGLRAPTFCENSLFQDLIAPSEVVKNPSQTLFYDALAVAAVEKGLLTNQLQRKSAGTQIAEFHKTVMNQSLSEFPLLCMTQDENHEYLNYSLAIEERLLPEFYRSSQGKAAHTKEFWENVEKKKYCWIDTDSVLLNQHWQRFFSNMKPTQT